MKKIKIKNFKKIIIIQINNKKKKKIINIKMIKIKYLKIFKFINKNKNIMKKIIIYLIH